MYDFQIQAADKATLYRELNQAADALTDGEPDAIANMANVAALLWESLPDLNWAGFYRNVGGELVLGPFQGRAACIRIPFGRGVCGTAASAACAAPAMAQTVPDSDYGMPPRGDAPPPPHMRQGPPPGTTWHSNGPPMQMQQMQMQMRGPMPPQMQQHMVRRMEPGRRHF